MKTIVTAAAPAHVGQEVQLQGWLHNLRRLGGISFLVLRDGAGVIQAVTETVADLAPLDGLALESVIRLTGTVVHNALAPGGVEIHRPRIAVITPVLAPPPVALHTPEPAASLHTLLDHAVIANRHPRRRAIFRLGAAVMAGFRRTLDQMGFVEIQSPKIVASATESGANVFRLGYFGRDAFLAQSPQFFKQIMVGVFGRVYEVGPVFRAEPHDTSRHTNEYVSLDVEFGFINDHFEVMDLLRQLLAGIFATLSATRREEIALLELALPAVPQTIPHIHFADAQALILARHGVDGRGEPDLSPQDERWLGQWAQEEYRSDFLFVTGYPMRKRPFYTHPDPARPRYSRSFDLLFRGLELVTGGQRLHRYADYQEALAGAGLDAAPFAAYLEAFRHGMPPHGGFAIGLERLLMQLLRLPNLRLATLFPRDMQRLSP